MSDARCLNWRLSPQQAPCRRLLTTLILDLEAHLFDTQHDIYMPNCDKRGFFRKKQVSVQGQDYGCSLWHVFLGTCQNRLIFFCDFRLMQCWSSRGKRRGKCWCVDASGMMVPSKGKQKGSLICWRPSQCGLGSPPDLSDSAKQELHQWQAQMKELQHSLAFLSPPLSTSGVTLSHCAL